MAHVYGKIGTARMQAALYYMRKKRRALRLLASSLLPYVDDDYVDDDYVE